MSVRQNSDKHPFFTVVIPTYNRAHTLTRAVESVLKQTFSNWELVVIDDGSTDGTAALMAECTDARIQYVKTSHAERSQARNTGIQLAKGAFLCFLDSDDQFLPNHLAVLDAYIQQQPNVHVFRTGAWLLLENQGATQCLMEEGGEKEPFPFECIQTFAFHRSLFTKLAFDLRFAGSEDLHFLVRAGLAAPVFPIPVWTVVYHSRQEKESVSCQAGWKKTMEKLTCIDDILTWNNHLIVPYLQRHRCLSSLLLLRYAHFRFPELPFALRQNTKSLGNFPLTYLSLLSRILVVKLRECIPGAHVSRRF